VTVALTRLLDASKSWKSLLVSDVGSTVLPKVALTEVEILTFAAPRDGLTATTTGGCPPPVVPNDQVTLEAIAVPDVFLIPAPTRIAV
jgi:hypothetical protein